MFLSFLFDKQLQCGYAYHTITCKCFCPAFSTLRDLAMYDLSSGPCNIWPLQGFLQHMIKSLGAQIPWSIGLLLLGLKCEQTVKTFNAGTCVASHTVFVIDPCISFDPEVILYLFSNIYLGFVCDHQFQTTQLGLPNVYWCLYQSCRTHFPQPLVNINTNFFCRLCFFTSIRNRILSSPLVY